MRLGRKNRDAEAERIGKKRSTVLWAALLTGCLCLQSLGAAGEYNAYAEELPCQEGVLDTSYAGRESAELPEEAEKSSDKEPLVTELAEEMPGDELSVEGTGEEAAGEELSVPENEQDISEDDPVLESGENVSEDELLVLESGENVSEDELLVTGNGEDAQETELPVPESEEDVSEDELLVTGSGEDAQETVVPVPGSEEIIQEETLEQIELASGETLGVSVTASELKCNEPVVFTIEPVNGSGEIGTTVTFNGQSDFPRYKYNMNQVYMKVGGAYTSVVDPSKYKASESNEITFTFTASGDYRMKFYVTDYGTTPARTAYLNYEFTINDQSAPTLDDFVDDLAGKCLAAGCETDYEKALYFHDWIIGNATYDYSFLYMGAEGVLLRGTGTCESYHRAMELLLGKFNIPCERAEGNGHVWSCVQLDGEWTQIDTTWDGSGGYDGDFEFMSHLYFGVTDEMIAKVHSEHKPVSERPCTSYERNYFIRSGEIARWTEPLKTEIEKKIAEGEHEFTIGAASSIYPDVYVIIYPLAAYALNQELGEKGCTVAYDSENTSFVVKVEAGESTETPDSEPAGEESTETPDSEPAGGGSTVNPGGGTAGGGSTVNPGGGTTGGGSTVNPGGGTGGGGSTVNPGSGTGGGGSTENPGGGTAGSQGTGNTTGGQGSSTQNTVGKTSCATSGHKFSGWSQTLAPSCTKTGIRQRTCSICGKTERQSIPAKGHTYRYVLGNKVKKTVCSVCGVVKASKKVTVKLNASSLPLQVKKTTSVLKISSKDSLDKVAAWKSSNAKIVKVNAKTGKITAKKAGTAYVTVTMKSGATAKCKIKVQKKKVTVSKLKVSPSSVTLKAGKKYQIKAVVTPLTATDKVKYASSKKKVATVNSKGVITAKKKGTAKITVRAGNKKKTVTVKVK